MLKEADRQATPEARYRGLLFIWVGQLTALAFLFAFTRFVAVERRGDEALRGQIFLALGGAAFALSFVLKRILRRRAVVVQRPDYVTTAYVLAFALSELPAILGLMNYFLSGDPLTLLFLLAAAGLLLHFPRRQHLVAASPVGATSDIKSTMH